MIEPMFTVSIEEDRRGRFTSCPLCDVQLRAYTEAGLMQVLCDHMNQVHHEPKIGHA